MLSTQDFPGEATAQTVVLDVEASGFGRGSYPIEVGVALASGHTACFLIRPQDDWTHWDPAAAALHGITREVLANRGRPVAEVAAALNDLLAGAVVYTDAWGMDSSWVALLFERARLTQRFRLEAIAGLLDDEQKAVWADCKSRVRAEMSLTRHRASADALVIQQALTRTNRLRRGPRRPRALSATSPE